MPLLQRRADVLKGCARRGRPRPTLVSWIGPQNSSCDDCGDSFPRISFRIAIPSSMRRRFAPIGDDRARRNGEHTGSQRDRLALPRRSGADGLLTDQPRGKQLRHVLPPEREALELPDRSTDSERPRSAPLSSPGWTGHDRHGGCGQPSCRKSRHWTKTRAQAAAGQPGFLLVTGCWKLGDGRSDPACTT